MDARDYIPGGWDEEEDEEVAQWKVEFIQRVSNLIDEYGEQVDLVMEASIQRITEALHGQRMVMCHNCRADRPYYEYRRCRQCWFIVCPNCPQLHDCSKSPERLRKLEESFARRR